MNPIEKNVVCEYASNCTLDENGVLTVPEGVTEVKVNAFRNHKEITKVILPSTLTRIGAYAWAGCVQLKEIESVRKTFRYTFDPTETDPHDTIIFGVDAWHGVPWARDRWGDFYIVGNQLHITFAKPHSNLVIPEGIRVLNAFSIDRLEAHSIKLPQTLESIKNFAFAETKVKETMVLPESTTELDEYALADCAITWTYNKCIKQMISECKKLPEEKQKRFPSIRQSYFFVTKSRKEFKRQFREFKQLQVKDRHPEELQKSLHSYMIDTSKSLGQSIYRRLLHDNVFISITHSNTRFQGLCIYKVDHAINALTKTIITPDSHEITAVRPFAITSSVIKKEEITALLQKWDGNIPPDDRPLHNTQTGGYEEWYITNSYLYHSTEQLLTELLITWMELNPKIEVEDNIASYLQKNYLIYDN